ncbi:TonB-dependent receptor [Oxalobacteraceae bacterium GrIS 1.18]
MRYPMTKQKLMSLAVASACAALVGQAYAEDAAAAAAPDADAVQSIVVTGLRASLQSTLNLKRDSDGIVDGVVAEDIGKFPDTNLAESLQRISGVSIDRSNGEGQTVTVRGLGPDFNMVLLNGRQMPTTNLGDRGGRSFDFSNIAPEAVSQIQVYKTGRAQDSAGGIGATINIFTARPFDNPGFHSSISIKGVEDKSGANLPAQLQFQKITPEASGLYSNTTEDGKFGVLYNASYQKRDSGFNSAGSPNGFQGPFPASNATSTTDGHALGTTTNGPTGNQIYVIPQNFGYDVTSVQSTRVNQQLVFQYKPNNELLTTLDFTFAEHKIHTLHNEVSAWFSASPTSTSTWPSGSAVSPTTYTENYQTIVDGLVKPNLQDVASVNADYATKTKNESIGFNAVWKYSPKLKLVFDAHHSSAESGKDSPFGSGNDLANASFSRAFTTIDYTHTLPVLGMPVDLANHPIQPAGSWFQNAYQKATVDQVQVNGSWKATESSNLNFGVGLADNKNHNTFSQVQNNNCWGNCTFPAGSFPASLYTAYHLPNYFTNIPGYNTPGIFGQLYVANFANLRAQTAAVAAANGFISSGGGYLPSDTPTSDSQIKENTSSAYASYGTDWDTPTPVHTTFGVRFEHTAVTATALAQPATGVTWVSQNELPLTLGGQEFVDTKSSYGNVLPEINADWEPRPDVKLRASAGETIGRARYDQMQGSLALGSTASTYNGTASVGNPALKPVKSKNLDFSAEWYPDKQTVLSAGYFRKVLNNYAGQQVISQSLYGLHTPVGGAYYNAALAAGCGVADTNCIRNYILTNDANQPGVHYTGTNTSGIAQGTIAGLPTDPLLLFKTNTYVNEKTANLNGLEFNGQHMFGETGFGLQGNYTYVHSPLKYDNNNLDLSTQFAIVGLSNSANLVGIYEDQRFSVRLAYNWRDKFLASTTQPGGSNGPTYTKAYGQVDLSVGYTFDKNISFNFDAINLNNAIQKQVGRSDNQVELVTQTGTRYLLGASYKF